MTRPQISSWFVVLVLALAAAGLFLGPNGWRIDFGLIGGAPLYVALGLFIVYLSRHSKGVFPAEASLAERQGWVGFVFVTLIALHFLNFMAALPALGDQADLLSNTASRKFGGNLVLLIIVWTVTSRALRAQNPDGVELDERDLRIHHGAQRLGSGFMVVLIVGVVVLLAMFPDVLRPWLKPVIVGNALLGLLIASQLAEHVSLLLRYRRSRA